MAMSDERAVEVGQFNQPGFGQSQTELVSYFEPTQIADLTRQGRLLVVADGGGGAAQGEPAARYAIQKILHDYYHSHEPDLEKRLLEVIRQTNQAIVERNRRFPDRRPIATTLLAALIHQNKLLVASVGDGRAYVVWDQDIEQLTSDNGSPQRQAREAEAAQEDASAETPPDAQESGSPEAVADAAANTSAQAAKSRLLAQKETGPLPSTSLSLVPISSGSPNSLPPSALGLTEQIRIDHYTRRLFAGDVLILCSGGLTGYVSEAEIAQTVSQHAPDPASRRLIELAAQRGCRDTLAVSVTRVLTKPITQAAPTRQTLPLAPDWEGLTKTRTGPLPPVTARPTVAGPIQPQRRWPFYVAALVALLVFSAIGFLAGGYWLSASSASPETALSQESGARNQSQEELPEDTQPAAADEQISPVATPQGGDVVQVQPSLTPAGTTVAAGSSPLPTPTESASPQTSDVIAPTPARPRPTPLPTIVVPAGCTNKGRFAGDATVRDGTEFAPGESFAKVWSVTNYGTCPWGGGYTVRFNAGDLMGAEESVPILALVEPEATGLITVAMTAPDLPGTYRGTWQMAGLDGEPFGPELYLEIKVEAGILQVDEAQATTLYDFVADAAQAQWSAGGESYSLIESPIDRNLIIPDPQGIVVVGPAEFRGDTSSDRVLMTHPHLELGLIEGTYQVDTPLQPTDALIGSLGIPKAAAINDDGVTFEVSFKPNDGPDQLLFSKSVKYEDSPISVRQALTGIQPDQTGAFILRVKGGDSLSYDWATWIELRLVRP